MTRPKLDETKRYETVKPSFRIQLDDWAIFKAHCVRHAVSPSTVIRYLLAWWTHAKKCIHGVPIHGGIVCRDCKGITER